MIESLAKLTMGLYAFWHYSDEQMKWLTLLLVAAGAVVFAVGTLIEHVVKGRRTGK